MQKYKRKVGIGILLALIVLTGFFLSSEVSDSKLKLTYIANEGFLIEAGHKSILIDALFGEKELGFCDIPTSGAIQAMTAAQDEFAAVDVIAVTHKHLDHFYAPFVAAHLSSNDLGKFISCEQTVDLLSAEKGYGEIRDRVIEITPDSLFYQDTVLNEIGVRVYRLAHGPYLEEDPLTGKSVNRHKNIQNLGFLFHIGGIKVFHCGDSSPRCWDDYEHFRLDREDIDIAILGRGFLASTNGFGIDIIRDLIKPDHIVLMHIHHDGNSYYQDIANQVKDEFPSVTIFENLMDSKVFPIQ